jgi:hypothetical protein
MAPAMEYRLPFTVKGFIRIRRQERMRSIGVHSAHNERFSGVYRCKARGVSRVVGAVLHALQTCPAGCRDTLPAVNSLES